MKMSLNYLKKEFSLEVWTKMEYFHVDSSIFFTRSWTDNCIFKIGFKKNNRKTILENLKVSRDENYNTKAQTWNTI